MDPCVDQAHRDVRGRATDAAGGVNAQERLADRSDRIGKVVLGQHHALEHVGRLADHDGVDVRKGEVRVFERAQRGFAQQARHRDVDALRVVFGLTDADHTA